MRHVGRNALEPGWKHGHKDEKVKGTRMNALQLSHAFLRHYGPVLFVLAYRAPEQRDVCVGHRSIAAKRQRFIGRRFLLFFLW